MYTITLSVLWGVLLGTILRLAGASSIGWSVGWGVLGGTVAAVLSGLWLRSRVKGVMTALQGVLLAGQKRMERKVAQWQMRPPGSVRQAQIELEREQRQFVEQALERAKQLEGYYRWVPLLSRQADTLRMQLHYQLKDYKTVDRLMPNCLFLDPLTAAMKLARMHVNNAEGAERFFEKYARRQRYEQGAILYALYAWMRLQKGDIAGAHKVLVRGCEKAANETLKRNLDHLANNRPAHFSNAGFGEEWYALGLEEPRVKVQRPRGPAGRPF